MRIAPSIRIACALALAPAGPAPAFLGDYELDTEQMAETGQEIFEFLAPASVLEEYEFASPADLAEFFAPIQAALTGESVEDLAAQQPRAQQMLAQWRARPETEGYADWLAARMDYFEVAAEAERSIPAAPPAATPPPPAAPPRPPFPPHPQTPAFPPHPQPAAPVFPPHPKDEPVREFPPHPPPAAPAAPEKPAPDQPASPPRPADDVKRARNRYVENREIGLKKIARRPAPARAAALVPELKDIFRAEGVPAALVWQAEAESTFNPAARSPAGAVGLYQFMPGTAQEYGLSLAPKDERLDALKNARAAARHLKRLHDRFGDWPLALAAYNAGEYRVARLLGKRGGKTFEDIHEKLSEETRMYVPKIAALLKVREGADLSRL